MKAYTDLEQSRVLSEILPLESADMQWIIDDLGEPFPFSVDDRVNENEEPCWSLTALLEVLPKFIGDYGKCLYYDIGGYYCGYMADGDFMLTIEETKADNPIDACVEMIVTLKEKGLL